MTNEKKQQILFVDACARKQSRTRELALYLLARLDGETAHLKLYETALSPMDEQGLAQREKSVACGDGESLSVQHAEQFAAADTIVIAAPYWDFSFPAILKDYIENISVNGVAFVYDETGQMQGLCKAKTLYYVTTAGGMIDADYGYGYLRYIAERYGIQKTVLIKAEKLDVFGTDVAKVLADTRTLIDAL